MQCAEKAIPPAYGTARRIHPVFPIVIGISKALAKARGRGTLQELPHRKTQLSRRRKATLAPGELTPVLASGGKDARALRGRVHSKFSEMSSNCAARAAPSRGGRGPAPV